MTIFSTIYVGLNLLWWVVMFLAVTSKKPGTRNVTWSAKEIAVWRGVMLAMIACGVMALFFGGGGREGCQ